MKRSLQNILLEGKGKSLTYILDDGTYDYNSYQLYNHGYYYPDHCT